jgi:uncharacterized protein YecE (DUF72 family)
LIQDLCAQYGLIHCVDPLAGCSAYGDVLYWRLHGKGTYYYRYTDEDLIKLRCMRLAHPRKKAYVLFNNLSMKEDAQRFRDLLQGS